MNSSTRSTMDGKQSEEITSMPEIGESNTDDDHQETGVTNENYVYLVAEGPDGSKEDQVAARLMESIAEKCIRDVRTLLQVR